MKRVLQLGRSYLLDGLILVALGIGLASTVNDYHHHDGPTGPLWFDVLVVIGFTTPLLTRRRYPVGALLTVALVVASSSFVDDQLIQDEFVAFLIGAGICVLFGMRPRRLHAVGGLALLLGANLVVSLNHPTGRGGNIAWGSIIFTVAWVIGLAIGGKFREIDETRELASRVERDREEQARLAVAEERARIARELHDVVGHSVSVMTVQASAVRRLLEGDQDREREALLVVEQTGREALAEMRRMVGVLRRPEEAPALAPQPSIENVGALVANARDAGLPVELRIEGKPEQLPAGIDLTAYRIVQEALTNAVKHARADRAEVVVRYANGTVELTVSDDGRGGGDGGGSGHGLAGMRERVSVYGGELEAGPQDGGGFRLRATLPIT